LAPLEAPPSESAALPLPWISHMMGGTDSEPSLQGVIQAPYGNACHAS
jgi:hypothetical protein